MKTGADGLLKKLSDLICRKRWYLIILAAVWILILILTHPFDRTNLVYFSHVRTMTNASVPIEAGNKAELTFMSDRTELKGITLQLGVSDGTGSLYQVTVTDRTSGSTVYDTQMDSASLTKGLNLYTILFDVPLSAESHIFNISLTCLEGGESTSLYLPLRASEDTAESYLINGFAYTDLSGNYKLISEESSLWLFIILFIIMLTSFILVLWGVEADEKGYLKLALLLGTWIIFLNSFPHMLDESTHYFRAFSLAQGDFEDTIEDGKIGQYVSDNYGDLIAQNIYADNIAAGDSSWNEAYIDEEVFYENHYMTSLIPIVYLPSAAGIAFGRLLNLSALGVILLGRIFNYLAAVFLCWYAVKRMRYYKSLAFWAACGASTLWLAASYSYDIILLGAILLFTALCFSYHFSDNEEEKISRKDIILILLCVLVISSVKYFVYTPLFLLFFLIPSGKFRSRKHYILMIVSALAIFGAVAVYQLHLLQAYPFAEDRNGHVDLKEQLAYILANKKATIRTFVNEIQSHVFYYLGYSSLSTGFQQASGFLAIGCGYFTFFAGLLCRDKAPAELVRKHQLRRNIFIILITVVIILLIWMSDYLAFTPVGASTIDGVQPRYFLPIWFLVMYLLSQIPVKNNIRHFRSLVAFAAMISLVNMLAGAVTALF